MDLLTVSTVYMYIHDCVVASSIAGWGNCVNLEKTDCLGRGTACIFVK